MVYFTRREGSHFIKIGCTGCVEERLRDLCCQYGSRFDVLGVMEGDRNTEASLHRQFEHLRVYPNREWFAPGAELLAFIDTNAKTFAFKKPLPRYVAPRSCERAKRIVDARKRAGMTQTQAAEKYGCHKTLWWQWEHGIKEPRLASLPRIASALGCKSSDLDPVLA